MNKSKFYNRFFQFVLLFSKQMENLKRDMKLLNDDLQQIEVSISPLLFEKIYFTSCYINTYVNRLCYK